MIIKEMIKEELSNYEMFVSSKLIAKVEKEAEKFINRVVDSNDTDKMVQSYICCFVSGYIAGSVEK